jgi:2'-5' RNA ligase
MTTRSAVIVQFSLPPALEQLRAAHDPVAANGVPAHVTILFPFVPVDDLTPAVRRRLADAVRGTPPFEVRFPRTGRFPGSLWLAPEPARPFHELIERVSDAFPEHPPYEGQHDVVVPHLTLALGSEEELDGLETATRASGIRTHRPMPVRRLLVIAEGVNHRWDARWRIALRP